MGKAIQALGFGALVVGATLVTVVPGEARAGADDVAIQGRQFTPRETTVEVGTEVTWTNKDSGHVHSVTADDGSFDSNPMCSNANPGACMDDRDTFAHVFATEGRYPYYSKTSGGPGGQGTSGVVVVVPAGTPKPEPTTTTTTSATPSTTSP